MIEKELDHTSKQIYVTVSNDEGLYSIINEFICNHMSSIPEELPGTWTPKQYVIFKVADEMRVHFGHDYEEIMDSIILPEPFRTILMTAFNGIQWDTISARFYDVKACQVEASQDGCCVGCDKGGEM